MKPKGMSKHRPQSEETQFREVVKACFASEGTTQPNYNKKKIIGLSL